MVPGRRAEDLVLGAVVDEVVVEGQQQAPDHQRRRVEKETPVPQRDAHREDHDQREQADPLVPAQGARRELHHLTEEQTPQRGDERDDPRGVRERV